MRVNNIPLNRYCLITVLTSFFAFIVIIGCSNNRIENSNTKQVNKPTKPVVKPENVEKIETYYLNNPGLGNYTVLDIYNISNNEAFGIRELKMFSDDTVRYNVYDNRYVWEGDSPTDRILTAKSKQSIEINLDKVCLVSETRWNPALGSKTSDYRSNKPILLMLPFKNKEISWVNSVNNYKNTVVYDSIKFEDKLIKAIKLTSIPYYDNQYHDSEALIEYYGEGVGLIKTMVRAKVQNLARAISKINYPKTTTETKEFLFNEKKVFRPKEIFLNDQISSLSNILGVLKNEKIKYSIKNDEESLSSIELRFGENILSYEAGDIMSVSFLRKQVTRNSVLSYLGLRADEEYFLEDYSCEIRKVGADVLITYGNENCHR